MQIDISMLGLCCLARCKKYGGNMKKIYFLSIVLLSAVLLNACNQSNTPSKLNVSLKGFGYFIDNVPQDYWASTVTTKPSLTYTFEFVFSGQLTASNIVSAKVFINDTDKCWTIDQNDFNEESNTLTGYNYYSNININELPIGKLVAKVILSDGSELSKTVIMSVPGSTSNGSYQYVYNPDNESFADYPSVTCKSIQRPLITKISRSTDDVSVSFTVIGSDVNNGCVWYYDATNRYLGTSNYFREEKSGSCFIGLNGGSGFLSSDGSNNIIISNNSQILKNGKAISQEDFNSIIKARIVVFDGEQYVSSATYINFDYRAISELSK
jgi:hypothetical protein